MTSAIAERPLLCTEAELLRTIKAGTYTIPELYRECETGADIARDGGLEPPDPEHPTDTVWRRRLRGALQTFRSAGGAVHAGRAVWIILGTRQEPVALVLVSAAGTLAGVELHHRRAVELFDALTEPVDLVLCDPPYGLLRGTERSSATRIYRRDQDKVIGGYIDVDPSEYVEFTRAWVNAAARTLRAGGQLAAITGPQRAAIVQVAAEDAGLQWVATISAFRHFALATKRRFAPSHWAITVMCRALPDSRRRVFNVPAGLPKSNNGLDYPLDWWPENGRSDRRGALRYDNGLPRPLVRQVIEAHTNAGELVVDPCLGGGTSAIEARALGRRFIGGDPNREGVMFAAARLLREHAWLTPATQPERG
jgi:hypothetical protein